MLASTAFLISCVLLQNILLANSVSSPIKPFSNYSHSIQLQPDLADLWWTVDAARKEIIFEFHVKTTGWIALGISPAGGMTGADIALGWIDQNGMMYLEDRHSSGPTQPLRDTTTSDWVGLQGREANGWTGLQFKRALDTCDTMDVPITSGTNILIYSYAMEDPQMNNGVATIGYHENRRYTKTIPLQSYSDPPAENKFAGLDFVDYKLDNYQVPDTDTTYLCKIFRAPTNFQEHKHAIGYKTIIDQRNTDLVHHILLYECNPDAIFDANNLPEGLCDEIVETIQPCSANIATTWAVGADEMSEFPENLGHPMGGDFEVKYYMIQMHYDNPKRSTNRLDSSGFRFYFGTERRQHEIGFLSLGPESNVFGITIPPRMKRFVVDSYCTSECTQRLPKDGITVFNAFPHTHLQGKSLWTKVIRNRTAVRYLFNAESYDFNYQYTNALPEPIKIYPGDELATQCIYQTMNKNNVTLGGESTKDEMCLHILSYYPRVRNMYVCFTRAPIQETVLTANNSMEIWDLEKARRWALERNWTEENSAAWQDFYAKAPRIAYAGRSNDFDFTIVNEPPKYKDLEPESCRKPLRSVSLAHHATIKLVFFCAFMALLFQ